MADVTLPTEEEIRRLPRWARVAFAARCARRALPLFEKYWSQAPEEYASAVQAIEDAEKSAETLTKVTSNAPSILTANAASHVRSADATYHAHAADNNSSTDDDYEAENAAFAGTYAAAAYAAAAAAAVNANEAALNASTANDATVIVKATAACDAYHKACEKYEFGYAYRNGAKNGYAAASYTAAARLRAVQSIRRDFQRILEVSQRQKWTDVTPVSPSVFPPIEDTPELPAEMVETAEPFRSQQFKLILDSYATDGTDPQEVRTRLVTLFDELDEYSFLKWGKRLTIDDFTQYMLAGVPEVVS